MPYYFYQYFMTLRQFYFILCLLVYSSVQGQKKEIDSLKQILKGNLDDTTRILTLDLIAYQAIYYLPPDSILSYSKKALELANKKENYRLRSWAYAKIGQSYTHKGQYDTAIQFLRKAIYYGNLDNRLISVGDAYNCLGNIHFERGNFDSTIFYQQKALSIFERFNRINAALVADETIGSAYCMKGNYVLGLQYFHKALERSKDKESGIPRILSNIGETYNKTQDYGLAQKYLLQGLLIVEVNENKVIEAHLLNNLGVTYLATKRLDSAFFFLTQSLKIAHKIDYQYLMGPNHSTLAELFKVKKDFTKAEQETNTALALYERLNNKSGLCESYLFLARLNFELGDFIKARSNVAKSLKLAREIKALVNEKDCLKLLSDLEAENRNFSKAYAIRTEYEALSDSIFNKEKAQQIANTEAIYQNKEKNKEIEFLQQRNQSQKTALDQSQKIRNLIISAAILLVVIVFLLINQSRIRRKASIKLTEQKNELIQKNNALENASLSMEKSLVEKNLLLKEIHHRVKNNLQIISSLLNIQSHSIKDANVFQAVKEGQNRVKSMALLHQQLYQQELLTGTYFIAYTHKLVDSLISSYNYHDTNVRVSVEGEEFLLDVDKAIPLGLIVNELVTNSLKHAFDSISTAVIEIKFAKHEESKMEIMVKDNGRGLPYDFNIEKSESLGLKLIRSFAEQLEGEVTFSSDHGTKCVLTMTL